MALNVERLSKGTSEYTKNGAKREIRLEKSRVGERDHEAICLSVPCVIVDHISPALDDHWSTCWSDRRSSWRPKGVETLTNVR